MGGGEEGPSSVSLRKGGCRGAGHPWRARSDSRAIPSSLSSGLTATCGFSFSSPQAAAGIDQRL